MKKISLIGVAGYVAKKHLTAIKETKNQLTSAFDIHDNVGILDSFFPDCDFFVNYERYERFIYKNSKKIDYITICSPNYLHDTHMRLALKNNIDVICEKPLVINYRNLKYLKKVEKDTKKKINCILQLRLHQNVKDLKKNKDKIKNINITYISPRGKWYSKSWKGNENKSGGIETNIGIHLFDLLHYVFGKSKNIKVYYRNNKTSSGTMEFGKVKVKWFLSIDRKFLKYRRDNKKNFIREFEVDGKKIDFSEGFHNLHAKSYEMIIKNKGFGIKDAEKSIATVNYIQSIKKIKRIQLSKTHEMLKYIIND